MLNTGMQMPGTFFCLMPLAFTATLACAQSTLDRDDAPGRAGPPVHVSEFGRYTVRASAVTSSTFGFGLLKNLHFTITAQPAGSPEPLQVDFEDRFVVRR